MVAFMFTPSFKLGIYINATISQPHFNNVIRQSHGGIEPSVSLAIIFPSSVLPFFHHHVLLDHSLSPFCNLYLRKSKAKQSLKDAQALITSMSAILSTSVKIDYWKGYKWSPCIYFSVLNLPAVTWRCYSLTQGGTVSFESITSTIFSESIISMEDNHCNHFLIINYLIQSLFYVDQICQNNFKFQGMRRWIEGGLGILREAIWLTAV